MQRVALAQELQGPLDEAAVLLAVKGDEARDFGEFLCGAHYLLYRPLFSSPLSDLKRDPNLMPCDVLPYCSSA